MKEVIRIVINNNHLYIKDDRYDFYIPVTFDTIEIRDHLEELQNRYLFTFKLPKKYSYKLVHSKRDPNRIVAKIINETPLNKFLEEFSY